MRFSEPLWYGNHWQALDTENAMAWYTRWNGKWIISRGKLAWFMLIHLGWSTSQRYCKTLYPAMELYKVNNSSSWSWRSTLLDAKRWICIIARWKQVSWHLSGPDCTQQCWLELRNSTWSKYYCFSELYSELIWILHKHSIYNAYMECILKAKHFIYIENQFFSKCHFVLASDPTY